MSESVIEVDATTGEVVERPLTEDEIAQRAVDASEAQAVRDRVAAREVALRKIAEASGLTPEEMVALGF